MRNRTDLEVFITNMKNMGNAETEFITFIYCKILTVDTVINSFGPKTAEKIFNNTENEVIKHYSDEYIFQLGESDFVIFCSPNEQDKLQAKLGEINLNLELFSEEEDFITPKIIANYMTGPVSEIDKNLNALIVNMKETVQKMTTRS